MGQKMISKLRNRFSRFYIPGRLDSNVDKLQLVSFTFDDVPQTGLIHGSQLLEQQGLRGTFYISMKFCNDKDVGGYFSSETLKTTIESGHEIGSHTFSHLNLSVTSVNSLKLDLQKNEDSLAYMAGANGMTNFSYPFGEKRLSSKAIIADRFRSARGVTSGINRSGQDIFDLRAERLYEDSLSLSHHFNKIDELLLLGGWLIFYTHDIQDNYSQYGCTETYFMEVLKYAKEKEVIILPINSALDLIGS